MAKKMPLSKRVKRAAKKVLAQYSNDEPVSQYRQWWKELPLDDTCVLIESQQGRTANGNMFYVVEELRKNPLYKNLKLNFVVKEANAESAKKLFKSHGIKGVNFVTIYSEEYVRLLASAKYLVTDTAFPNYYLPKEGQIVWNTWHGTPLKQMGRYDEEDLHALGSVQKNFINSTYLSYPNEHTRDHMIDAYMLDGLTEANVILAGYPRNSVLFDTERLAAVREALLEDDQSKMYVYMPTWRPARKGVPARFRGRDVMQHLLLIDDLLNEDEVMYVNVHPLEKKAVAFNYLKHVKPFPPEFETYEVLGACDVLATDYSSVFFDFANTGKKIVQFLYDRSNYERHRGMIFPVDDLPFTKVGTVSDLVDALRSPKEYDDAAFVKTYCKYDTIDATKRLCEAVFLGNMSQVLSRKMELSQKERVLIYAGNLAGNGITRSLTSLLQHIDTSEKDYYLTFTASSVAQYKNYLKTLPEGVRYIPMFGGTNLTASEKSVTRRFLKGRATAQEYDDALSDLFEMERVRFYGSLRFDTVIQFNGYDNKEILFYEKFPARRVIFAHSDTKREAELKGNSRLDVLRLAYQRYDRVAVVSEGVVPSIEEIADGKATVQVVPNVFNYENVVALGEKPMAFDPETESNVSLKKLRSFFDSGKVIVSVGRFSPEKQHKMLLDAFNKAWLDNPDAHLVIIGGVSRGDLYQETCEYAESLPCGKNVALILNMSNPFSVVARSDGFILTSAYEGFGIVLLEADVLGKPVVSTDIDGPRAFLQKHGGTLVPNSAEGVEEGVRLLLSGEAPCMNVDYEVYNEEAVSAFERLSA
ncbi:MAG: glycosyltransferase [Adlercreutzia sp.]|nr:glycosyltransferase [Adlercreutzia sp.]